MRSWFTVGLFCLCALVYYETTNNRPETKYLPPVSKDTDLVSMGEARPDGETLPGIVPPADADPGENGIVKSSQQRNAGMFLAIDGEPGNPVSLDISSRQNVGTFLNLDDSASDFIASTESEVVNIGDFMDLDDSR